MAQQSMPKAGLEQPAPGKGLPPDSDISEAQTEIWVPVQSGSRKANSRPSMGKLLLGGLLIFIISAACLGIAFFSLLFYYSDMIFPGVEVMGIDVGSMTTAEAEAVLVREWEGRSLLLTGDEGVWPVGVTDLGLALNVPEVIASAHAQGRSLSGLSQILLNGAQVKPRWNFDSTKAAQLLEELAPQVGEAPVNAGIQIRDGQVIEIPPEDGQALDLELTLRQLQENQEMVLTEGRLPLIMRSVPAQSTDVSHLAEEARRLLSTTVTIHAYDPIQDEKFDWTVEPQQWNNWLSLEAGQGEDQFDWIVDEELAREFLAHQQTSLGSERYLDSEELIPRLVESITTQQPLVNARIYHAPRRHIVQSGESLSSIGRDYGIPYPWIQQANPGSEFLHAGDEIVVPSADEMVPLPVVEDKRVIVSISQQRAWVYENGQVKWEWPASTGIDSSPTAPGIFQIQSHEPNAYASNWDLWMPNFMGIYRPIPTSDFMNGFHGFPTRNGSTLLWTGDLGHKVTYGCILISSENAALLYDWAEDGVVVEVAP